MPTRFRLSLLGLVFAMSGFAALVYQVAWQRILAFHSGVGIYSVAMIVAAFMGGMGLGSYLGGRLSARFSASGALRVFAFVEFGIGAFALLSCHLYYDVLYLEWSALYRSGITAGLLHFTALIIPTTLMGMSLPFLVQAAVVDVKTSSRTIGTLYGLNVIGAALGAILSPWVLIRGFGIDGAVFIGAACNLLAGTLVILLWLQTGRTKEARAADLPAPEKGFLAEPAPREHAIGEHAMEEPAGRDSFSLWVILYGLSGFCALALELIWFRVIDVAVKSTAFTFGTVLSIFLAGLAAGSLAGGRVAPRVVRPLEAFLTAQCVLLAYSAAAMLVLVALPAGFPGLSSWMTYWAQSETLGLGGGEALGLLLSLYLLLPLLLYGPPTFLMGISFALLQRAVQNERQNSGLKVGLLQAANIVGNVAGSLLVGLVLLSWLGTMGTLRAVVALAVPFAAIGLYRYGYRSRFMALGIAVILLLAVMPDSEALWSRLHGATSSPVLFEEDASGLAAITTEGVGGRVSVNGKHHSWLPFGGLHTVLGAIPALIHQAPENVAIIGLGSGDTAWAASFRPETKRTIVFEIVAPERRLLERFSTRPFQHSLKRFLADDRVEIVAADGRSALLQTQERYDVIEADALRPHSAYSGNLYSVEFFAMAAGRLKEGGLMCTWAPTERIRRSFAAAFPEILQFGDEILVGSEQPIEIDQQLWRERLSTPETRDYFRPRIAQMIKQNLSSVRRLPRASSTEQLYNRDLFPRDEFRSPSGS